LLFLDLALFPQPPCQFNTAIMIPSFPLAKLFLSVCVTVEDFAYISYSLHFRGQPVLRIRDVYPGSEFFHPRSRIQGPKDSGSRTRIRIKVFLALKTVSKLSEN
jgi:hypothetical protein